MDKRATRRMIGVVCLVLLIGQVTFAQERDSARTLLDINQAIQMNGATWEAAPSPVADLPVDSLCGSVLHPEAQAAILAGPKTSTEGAPSGSPATFDWRTYGGHDWTTPIRNQNPCGSCYIFGTCAAAEASMKKQAGTYGYLAQPDFSEQFILSCNGWSCTGGYSGDTLNYLKNSGAPVRTSLSRS